MRNGRRPAGDDGQIRRRFLYCLQLGSPRRKLIGRGCRVRFQTSDAIAPDLLWHEVRNVLMMARKRNRIDFDKACEGVKLLRGLSIFTRRSSSDDMILDLAERHQLTAYDAAYLALAIESKLPLATLDKQLIAAAAREGVPLLS